MDEKFPQFSEFWFVFSLGKKSEWQQTTTKQLEQKVDLNNMKQLEQAKVFMEGIGFSDTAGASSVKIENAKFSELQKQVELMKLPYSSDKLPGDTANLLLLLAAHRYTFKCMYAFERSKFDGGKV